MLKLGIIGAGIACKLHARALHKINDIKVQAIADIVLGKAMFYAVQFGAKAYDDYRKMVLNEDLDAVIINLPHRLHREATIFCAQRGVHILVEKPMGVSVEDCQAMIEAARKNNVKLMVGHVERFSLPYIKLKQMVQSGELGELVSIVDTRTMYYFRPERPRWFLDEEMSGGGMFINLGVHSIDRIMWITDSKVKKVVSRIGFHEPGFNVEGNVQAFLELENGVTAVITCVGYKVPILNETICYFTKGVARYSGEGFFVSKGGQPYIQVDIPRDRYDEFQVQINEFANSIITGAPVPIPGEYGMEIIRVVESVYSPNKRLGSSGD